MDSGGKNKGQGKAKAIDMAMERKVKRNVDKQRQENGTGNAFSCRICMSL